MHDPIGSFLRIRDLYITYLETAFRIADPRVSSKRRDLLESPGNLCAEVLIEPLPRYKSSGIKVEDLVTSSDAHRWLPSFSEDERRAFAKLCLAGLIDSSASDDALGRKSDYELYSHQAEMLSKGVRIGTPGIVTSGTGSGKTESFLLPIFASLAKEALHWSKPNSQYLQDFWWRDSSGDPYVSEQKLPNRPSATSPKSSPFRPHRTGETRHAAVRALILYPMNALVEDQMVRLRKALDSPLARQTFAKAFGDNRIFLGRYTSQTPVTGFNVHPRSEDGREIDRRKRKISDLLAHSRELNAIHRSAGEDEARYLFPTLDGNELWNRWDMQATPPDILVTNISMLSAMLQREVDDPIFDATRRFIEDNDDAYFYLAIDELHLQRGSAGTEVSYLLMTLLERLGLTSPAHRHKLRVLASSASLPVTGPEAQDSLEYLWNMFGTSGLHGAGAVDQPFKDGWREAIVAGEVHRRPTPSAEVDSSLLKQLNDRWETRNDDVLQEVEVSVDSLRLACDALHTTVKLDTSETITDLVTAAADYLAQGCWNETSQRYEATPLSTICFRLFGSTDATDALRSLTLLRGLSEKYSVVLPNDTPSFRIHNFFRNIDGLYGPANILEVDDRDSPQLSVERGLTGPIGETSTGRFLQLLYCEACGDLFMGGMRGALPTDLEVELLPASPDLESAPEGIQPQMVEDYSWQEFALFWPRRSDSERIIADCWVGEEWIKASLDSSAGRLSIAEFGEEVGREGSRYTSGYVYVCKRARGAKAPHDRTPESRGSGMPFQCPNCKTDYSVRRGTGSRKSPVRGFRPGFTKTSQLLVSELFAILHKSGERSKLISFSDSRQDAAKTSLDIERRHHEDLWRVAFVEALKQTKSSGDKTTLQIQLASAEAELNKALKEGKFASLSELGSRMNELKAKIENGSADRVRVDEVIEKLDSPDYVGPKEDRKSLRPLLKSLVSLGVSPLSASGGGQVRTPQGKNYGWYELFAQISGSVDWADSSTQQSDMNMARQILVSEAHSQLNEVLFSKTYFALEETGLGYPAVRSRAGDGSAKIDRLNAFLRVLADDYQYALSKWRTEPTPWPDGASVRKSARFRRLAEALAPSSAAALMTEILDELTSYGHGEGIIRTEKLDIVLPKLESKYWRCSNCGRVHMHLGLLLCTRCRVALPESPTGLTSELRTKNYLAKRVERSMALHGLHSEELTGQTDNPAERQRLFKNIVLDSDLAGLPKTVQPVRRESLLIDLLAVTTTMEVGVDIGPLRAVFQANMPPQRFNYQQRVGRAGRRGQAFSSVLTLCRSRSHDLHYFRNVAKITNDNPPPPFINSQELAIPRRLILKEWFRRIFIHLREECISNNESYPGDSLSPPDIHGEFVPFALYNETDGVWRNRILGAMEQTADVRDHLITTFLEDKALSATVLRDELEPSKVLASLDYLKDLIGGEERTGLAHSMAEGGLLPMYGMPTRVKRLYHEIFHEELGQYAWKTIDRDVDIAIHEFAPGQTIVKDKLEHLCIGFSGALRPAKRYRKDEQLVIDPTTDTFEAEFLLQHCSKCGAWAKTVDRDESECSTCGHKIDGEDIHLCRTPAAFRTDFRPSTVTGEIETVRRFRSVAAESVSPILNSSVLSSLSVGFSSQSRTYRINSGDVESGANYGVGFTGRSGTDASLPVRDSLLHGQFIPQQYEPQRYIPDPDGVEETFWLAAGKITDSIFLSSTFVSPYLHLEKAAGAERSIGVRAAAISATFILAGKAALTLDADPEELECMEPRLLPHSSGTPLPLLQISDRLINGSGYSRRLSETSLVTHRTRIEELVSEIVSNSLSDPLRVFLAPDHRRECDKSCYGCLQRYGNQSYHSLLDWRLGLAYLKGMSDKSWKAGLDGDFGYAAINDWPQQADSYCRDLLSSLPALKGRVTGFSGISILWLDGRETPYVAIHPLWRWRTPAGVLRELLETLPGRKAYALNTFELSRRMFAIRQELQNGTLPLMSI